MPTISWFCGIAIRMFVVDHPPPHFHAVYGEFKAMVSIETGQVLEGQFPRRAAKLVEEWALIHRSELLKNWELASNGEHPDRIEGLDANRNS